MAAETTTMTIRTLIGFCASVAWLLVTIIGSQVMLLGGRAIGCAWKNGFGNCPFDEVQYAVEQISALLATVIALLFALLKK
jgi:hypothetical protein